MALRADPAMENESVPATDILIFTSLGLGVAATNDTPDGNASCRTFLSKVMISPLARSGREVHVLVLDFLLRRHRFYGEP